MRHPPINGSSRPLAVSRPACRATDRARLEGTTSAAGSRVVALLLGALIAALALLTPGLSQAGQLPKQFEGVDILPKMGDHLDLQLRFRDHTGKDVKLADFFDGERPVIMTLNYYRCDSLCNTQLNDLLKALKELEWSVGKEFRIVTVSFNPTEGADLAAGKRKTYLDAYGRGDVSWDFLTGKQAYIKSLADSLGYYYRYDANSGQFAHSPVIFVLSPDGLIARYLFGIGYPTQQLKFSLMEASEGRLGSLGEKILLSCFVFHDGEYSAFAWGIMRIGGGLILLALGTFLFIYWRRERRQRLPRTAEATA